MPNFLSGFRIASVPFLIGLAWGGHSSIYIVCLAISFLTDFFDGFLARFLNQQTELGAKLDLWGDAGVLLSVPVACGWLWPDILRSQKWLIVVAVCCYAVSVALAVCKFGHPASYHTLVGKTATMALSIGLLLSMLRWSQWPMRGGLFLMIIAIFEEISISVTLVESHSNILSWWHARQLTDSVEPTVKELPGPTQIEII